MSTYSPAARRRAGRIGAHSLHSRYDSRDLTRNARIAFLQGFIDEVDPERTLPEKERLRRAAHARSAHFIKLAYLSAKARRKRAKERENGGGT